MNTTDARTNVFTLLMALGEQFVFEVYDTGTAEVLAKLRHVAWLETAYREPNRVVDVLLHKSTGRFTVGGRTCDTVKGAVALVHALVEMYDGA